MGGHPPAGTAATRPPKGASAAAGAPSPRPQLPTTMQPPRMKPASGIPPPSPPVEMSSSREAWAVVEWSQAFFAAGVLRPFSPEAASAVLSDYVGWRGTAAARDGVGCCNGLGGCSLKGSGWPTSIKGSLGGVLAAATPGRGRSPPLGTAE